MGLATFGVFLFFYVYIGFFDKEDNKQGDADFSLRQWLNPLQHPSRKGTGHRARQVSLPPSLPYLCITLTCIAALSANAQHRVA